MNKFDFSYFANKIVANDHRKHLLEAFYLSGKQLLILHTRNIKECKEEEPTHQIYVYKKEEDNINAFGFIEYVIRGECCKIGVCDIEEEEDSRICGLIVYNRADLRGCKKFEDFVKEDGTGQRPTNNLPFEAFKDVLGFDAGENDLNKYSVIISEEAKQMAIENYNSFVLECSQVVGENPKKIRAQHTKENNNV